MKLGYRKDPHASRNDFLNQQNRRTVKVANKVNAWVNRNRDYQNKELRKTLLRVTIESDKTSSDSNNTKHQPNKLSGSKSKMKQSFKKNEYLPHQDKKKTTNINSKSQLKNVQQPKGPYESPAKNLKVKK